ncbi:MAG TPA: hypothetical protein ENK08_01205 [Chloroflexi bacterium]|nr:hypothetical protein [Chloroflexota bacterium]
MKARAVLTGLTLVSLWASLTLVGCATSAPTAPPTTAPATTPSPTPPPTSTPSPSPTPTLALPSSLEILSVSFFDFDGNDYSLVYDDGSCQIDNCDGTITLTSDIVTLEYPAYTETGSEERQFIEGILNGETIYVPMDVVLHYYDEADFQRDGKSKATFPDITDLSTYLRVYGVPVARAIETDSGTFYVHGKVSLPTDPDREFAVITSDDYDVIHFVPVDSMVSLAPDVLSEIDELPDITEIYYDKASEWYPYLTEYAGDEIRVSSDTFKERFTERMMGQIIFDDDGAAANIFDIFTHSKITGTGFREAFVDPPRNILEKISAEDYLDNYKGYSLSCFARADGYTQYDSSCYVAFEFTREGENMVDRLGQDIMIFDFDIPNNDNRYFESKRIWFEEAWERSMMEAVFGVPVYQKPHIFFPQGVVDDYAEGTYEGIYVAQGLESDSFMFVNGSFLEWAIGNQGIKKLSFPSNYFPIRPIQDGLEQLSNASHPMIVVVKDSNPDDGYNPDLNSMIDHIPDGSTLVWNSFYMPPSSINDTIAELLSRIEEEDKNIRVVIPVLFYKDLSTIDKVSYGDNGYPSLVFSTSIHAWPSPPTCISTISCAVHVPDDSYFSNSSLRCYDDDQSPYDTCVFVSGDCMSLLIGTGLPKDESASPDQFLDTFSYNIPPRFPAEQYQRNPPYPDDP